MNIEQYRALKAQEESEKNQPEVEQPTQPEEPIVETSTVVETEVKTPDEDKGESTPQTIKIGEEEVSIEELKNGYLRQSDYTKKTQEVSKQRKEAQEALDFYNQVKKNPELIENIQSEVEIPSNLDPTQKRVNDLESKIYEMMLEKEIETLQNKYEDFEVMEVLELADKKGMTDLEDAYHIVKSSKAAKTPPTDLDALREQLKQELLQEIKNENVSTNSIITSGESSTSIQEPKATLSAGELKVASMMGMKAEEYIKWRDVGTRK